MPITDDYRPPVVRHRKMGSETKKLKAVIKAFSKTMENKAVQKLSEGWDGWDNAENLLDMRKALVEHIKTGMLERRDQEEDIALLACFVWFNRLGDEAQKAITEAWG